MKAKKRPVVWTEVAARDLERIAEYLADHASLRGEAIIDRIVARAESLQRTSTRGRVPPELRPLSDRTWLELQESPWRILYRLVDDRRVEIHAVLDGRRDLADILLERLVRP